ncbi:sensor histidine kinase [Nonomuraea sp. NPDC049028]|uniref:sensor histidine kinase n=1 Tax=Nonomuraea sp. NPDC049028 TaxID=3364348 RepID=UPI0037186755
MQVSRRIEGGLPVLLGPAVFVVSAVPFDQTDGLTSPVFVTTAAAAGVAAWWARRSWWPLAVLGAVFYVWLVMWPPLMVASYYAGTTLRGTRGITSYLGGTAVALGTAVVVGDLIGGRREMVTATPANVALMAMALVGLPFVFGLWTRARRDVLAAARERADRLEREQVMRAEQARAQERARIAREMHDVVAHRVSLMVLHAGALEVRAADEPTARTASMIGDIGREALANLRELLGVLRSNQQPAELSPQPTLADLDRLLDQSRALGISVRRHDHGQPRALGSTVERTAYRVVQEALTNVHKHARDAHTDVHVRFLNDTLQVEILNRGTADGPGAERPLPDGQDTTLSNGRDTTRSDGPGAEQALSGAERALPGAGWGLAGLRERVELLGGSLAAGPRREGGYRVTADIPVRAAA